MPQTIAYSDALVALADDDLTRVVTLSHLPRIRIADLYDLSARLAHDDAIDRRLSALSTTQLHELLTPGLPCPTAVSLLLADHAGVPLPGVSDRIAALEALPPAEVVWPDDLVAPAPWHSVVALQTIALQWEHTALPLTATGHVPVSTLTDVGRILDIEPSVLSGLVSIGIHAGLFRTDGHSVLVTEQTLAWLDLSLLEAWRALADATVSPDLAGVVDAAAKQAGPAFSSRDVIDAARAHWPLSRIQLPERLTRLLRDWSLLGMVNETGGFTDLGTAWLNADRTRLHELADLWPALTDYGYLYNHLELLVPGLLAPGLTRRLRGMATPTRLVETHTYQITEQTVNAALTAGATLADVRSFLSALLRGDLTQPLEYLLKSLTDSRRAHDPQAPDSSSRLPSPDDGHQPGISTSALGHPVADVAADERNPVTRTLELVGEFRDAPDARIRLLLETALREHVPVSVAVRVGDGTRIVVLEVIGLGATRLRGREPGSETERTLPLTAIVEVHPTSKESSWDH